MKNQQFGKRIIVSILIICICQPNMAARMIKGTKASNITEINKQSNQTFEMNGDIKTSDNSKTTTIAAFTTTTTLKPELDTTTLPADFDEVDGRHAFINNQFVADDDDEEESLSNDPTMAQKLPPSPISSYETAPTDDYEEDEVEEETSDYASESEAVPENCEDTQESFVDSNDKDVQIQEQDMLTDNAQAIYAATYQNKYFDAGNYKLQTNGKLVGSYYNNKFVPNTNRNPGLLYATKPATKPPTTTNTNKKQLQTTPQHSAQSQLYQLVKSTAYNQKPQTSQQIKEYFSKPLYTLYDKLNLPNNTTEALNFIMPNFSYGNNVNMPTTSPFSTTSGQNKKYKTVSSSLQYVSTPLADLVFKYSIGMAKHPIAKAIKSTLDQHGISEATNYINGKTE